jgi:hypothetical protein
MHGGAVDQTCYYLLGVPLDVADDELHAHFEARKEGLLALAATSAKDKRAATQALSRLNKAYMVLANAGKRRAYDEGLYRQALADTAFPQRLAHAFSSLPFSTAPRRVLFLALLLVALPLLVQCLLDGPR